MMISPLKQSTFTIELSIGIYTNIEYNERRERGRNSMKSVHVITGGTGGIGKQVAEQIGRKDTVLLADINAAMLEETKSDLASKGITDVHYQTVDIINIEDVKKLVKKASSLGKLKSLIHTAGLSPTMADF